MISNTISTVIADLKQGLPTQITIIIALYASFPLYECKCKHAIVNVWRPAENFGVSCLLYHGLYVLNSNSQYCTTCAFQSTEPTHWPKKSINYKSDK